MSNHTYEERFYEYINAGSGKSAQAVVPLVIEVAGPIHSVLDVGCGQGAWLAIWSANGVKEIIGVDGAYINTDHLLIPSECFQGRDLTRGFDLNRKFDLVECLEVAEHLPETGADQFVSALVRHADVVMFSAAVPGQGGEFHVNEQPLGYWREKFRSHNFTAFDAVRPSIAENTAIEPWYRYNTLIYANPEGAKRLSPSALATKIDEGKDIPELAPLSWRIRNKVIGAMPQSMVEAMAQAKHSFVRRMQRPGD